MRFTIGWLAGVATAWAALAIWQRVPTLDECPEPHGDDQASNEQQVLALLGWLPGPPAP